jgi:hypothetical protein
MVPVYRTATQTRGLNIESSAAVLCTDIVRIQRIVTVIGLRITVVRKVLSDFG